MDGAQHFRTENVNVIEIIFRARALINSDNLFTVLSDLKLVCQLTYIIKITWDLLHSLYIYNAE